MGEKKEAGVGRHIPYIMAMGAVLAAYKMLNVSKYISGDPSAKELLEIYDYIIGKLYTITMFQWFNVFRWPYMVTQPCQLGDFGNHRINNLRDTLGS